MRDGLRLRASRMKVLQETSCNWSASFAVSARTSNRSVRGERSRGVLLCGAQGRIDRSKRAGDETGRQGEQKPARRQRYCKHRHFFDHPLAKQRQDESEQRSEQTEQKRLFFD